MKTVTPSSAARAAEQLADLDDAGRIQPIGRLIEDEQLRRRQQRTSKGQPLQVAERQRAGSPIGIWLECQPLDDSIDPGRIGHPGQATGDVEVLSDGELRVGGRRLDEVAHSPPQVRGSAVHPLAEQLRVPRRRPDHPEQHSDRRRLAGSVETEERVDLAARDAQVDLVDRQHTAPVLLGEASRGDREVAHGCGPSPS